MTENKQIFYYSRDKLGMYLLFNLGLLALALLFTWTVFPDYKPVYYFALITCLLSILSSLYVFLFRMPAVIISDKDIKIDHNKPLKWTQVQKVERVDLKHWGFHKSFLKIIPQKISGYKMSFMQTITEHSQFGAFSVPLYAMDDKDSKKVEKIIHDYVRAQSALKSAPKTKKKSTAKVKAKKRV